MGAAVSPPHENPLPTQPHPLFLEKGCHGRAEELISADGTLVPCPIDGALFRGDVAFVLCHSEISSAGT